MPVARFSDKVLKMWETLKPYIGVPGGLRMMPRQRSRSSIKSTESRF